MSVNRFLSAVAASLACASPAFAVDGVTLINQASINAAGGFYAITQPGSYRLSGNIDTPRVSCGNFFMLGEVPCSILVSAPNVTLDLNGFRLVSTSAAFTVPVLVLTDNASSLRIMNGTIVADVPFFGANRNGATTVSNLMLKDLVLVPSTRSSTLTGFTVFVQNVVAPRHDFLSDGACPGLVTGSIFRAIYQVCTSVGNSTAP